LTRSISGASASLGFMRKGRQEPAPSGRPVRVAANIPHSAGRAIDRRGRDGSTPASARGATLGPLSSASAGASSGRHPAQRPGCLPVRPHPDARPHRPSADTRRRSSASLPRPREPARPARPARSGPARLARRRSGSTRPGRTLLPRSLPQTRAATCRQSGSQCRALRGRAWQRVRPRAVRRDGTPACRWCRRSRSCSSRRTRSSSAAPRWRSNPGRTPGPG